MGIEIKGVGKPKGGGGGMDIATKRDALVDKMSKAMTSAMRGSRGLSDQDVARALSRVKGMIGGKTKSDKITGGRTTSNKAGGGKAKKMMAKGGTAGGKKKMMGGGKAKKMMRGGGKTKKYMARGGKAK